MALSLKPYKNQAISHGKEEERTSKVTLEIWLQGLGKELGRRTSLHFTSVSCDIVDFINRGCVGCFPILDCLCKFMYSLIENWCDCVL